MYWTIRHQIRTLIYAVSKVVLFPLWFPIWVLLWPIKVTYTAEKAKQLETEECNCVNNEHDRGSLTCPVHMDDVKVFVHGKEMKQSETTYTLPKSAQPGLSEKSDWTITAPAFKVEEMGATPKSAKHFIDAANSADNPIDEKIRKLHKQGWDILRIAQRTYRSRGYVKDVLKLELRKMAILTVLDSCGIARQQVQIDGNIFDQCIKARKFQATIVSKESYVVGAVTLENSLGEIVCREPRAICLGEGDRFGVYLSVSNRDVDNLAPKVKELEWMGTKISKLEGKRLYNIHQALRKGHWADGTLVTFAAPIRKALVEEFDKRQFNNRQIRGFIKQNEAWEAANPR